MFAAVYFPARYFAPYYWPEAGLDVVIPPSAHSIFRSDQSAAGSDVFRIDQSPGSSDLFRSDQSPSGGKLFR